MIAEQEPLPLAFGSWELAPISPAGDVSFDLQSVPDQQIAYYKLDLSGDSQTPEAELIEKERFLRASQKSLDTAPEVAVDFVRKIQDLGPVSYEAVQTTPLSPIEKDALRWMTYLEYGPDEVSFAVSDQVENELKIATWEFHGVMERMLQQVSHLAWVETLLNGQTLAHTVVSWGGDMQTTWGQGLEPDSYRLHQHALHQALATRNILVHACLVTTQSAAKLAVLLTNPAGAIMALPVAWKLVRQILTDVEKYREITSQ